VKANRVELMRWVESRRHPFVAGLEVTIFTSRFQRQWRVSPTLTVAAVDENC
jgi:hypothetical protein